MVDNLNTLKDGHFRPYCPSELPYYTKDNDCLYFLQNLLQLYFYDLYTFASIFAFQIVETSTIQRFAGASHLLIYNL